MKITVPKEEVLKKFNETILRIKSFCETYESGDLNISKDIAVKIRLLFHNTTVSKALFDQAKLIHIHFFDSASPYKPYNLMAQFYRVCIKNVNLKSKTTLNELG